MHKGFLRTGFLFLALAVGLGAFAAHSLKGLVSDKAVETFQTGVQYMLYHAVGLVLVGILYKEFPYMLTRVAGRLFALGILLFSFSLLVLAALQGMVQPGYRWVGAITPLGGLCFITGWVLLFIATFKKR